MGENECFVGIPNMEDYLEMREFIPPKDTEVISKEEFIKELGVKPHEVKFNIPNCKVSYKDGMIVVDEFTPISEDTAQRLDNAFKDLRKAVGGCPFFTFPSKRKARKHYKPKFTL